ncbi:WD40 repeat domain-containing serine/threonine protein kinase [Streptomyces sp. NPDC055025]
MPDQILAGRYRLVRQLGEGGMGEVWEARDEVLGRLVAVKVISMLAGGGSRGGEARARFLREARITAALQHLNIVTIHDLGETESDDGVAPFLVMELLRGEGLDAVMRRRRISLRDAARWGAEMCDGLAEAHAAGILHRDIKPANVVVTASGTVKILDFGIARAADPSVGDRRLTQTGFIVGTPQYMAPEQARGHAEQSSDLYALGCVLFEMITGRLPFRTPDTMSCLAAHLTQEPPAPSSIAEGIPPIWDEVVLTLLEKDPGRRYASAADLSRALRPLAHGSGPTPTVVDPTGQPGRGDARTRTAPESPPPPPMTTRRLTGPHREPSGEFTPSHRMTMTVDQPVVSVAFCPGRDWIVLGLHGGAVVVADLRGRERYRLDHRSGWTEIAMANVGVHPDGTRLATARKRDKSLRIWDVATGNELQRFPIDASTYATVFSPDGHRIATAGGGWARLWDAHTGQLLARTRGRSRNPTGVAFSPDSRRLAVSGRGTVSITDAADGEGLLDISLDNARAAEGNVSFSPDGRRLAIPVLMGSPPKLGLHIVDSFSGSKLVEIPSDIPQPLLSTSVAFGPRGDMVAATPNSEALVWDAVAGKLLLRVTRPKTVYNAAFSPDGTMVATSSMDKTVQIWNL